MTKTTREIESGKNNELYNALIFLMLLSIITMLVIYHFGVVLPALNEIELYHSEIVEPTLDEIPQTICSTEKVIEKVLVNDRTSMVSYPFNAEIICEEGATIKGYEFLNEKIIFGCLYLDSEGECAGHGKTCMVRYDKETCEIKVKGNSK